MDKLSEQAKKWSEEMEIGESISVADTFFLYVNFTGPMDSKAKIIVSYD